MPKSLQTVKGVTLFHAPGVGGDVPLVAVDLVDGPNQLSVGLTLVGGIRGLVMLDDFSCIT